MITAMAARTASTRRRRPRGCRMPGLLGWSWWRSWCFLPCREGSVERGGDQTLGIAGAGRGAGDQDPVPHRPGHLVDQHFGVDVAAQPLDVAGVLQPGLG